MKLRHLRVAVTLAEELNFTRAARRCNLSQPSLSRLVAELESELGTVLFRRDHHRVMLTPEAEVFLPSARAALSALEAGIRNVHRQPAGPAVRIALSDYVFGTPFVNVLQAVRAAHPHLQLLPLDARGAEGRSRLLAGEADLGVLALPEDLSDLTAVSLWEEPVHVFMPASHPLTSSTDVSVDALIGELILAFPAPRHPVHQGQFGRLYDLLSAQVQWRWLSEPTPTARQVWDMVGRGEGLHIAPSALGRAYPLPSSVVSRRLRADHAATPLVLAWGGRSDVVNRFLEVLEVSRPTAAVEVRRR